MLKFLKMRFLKPTLKVAQITSVGLLYCKGFPTNVFSEVVEAH